MCRCIQKPRSRQPLSSRILTRTVHLARQYTAARRHFPSRFIAWSQDESILNGFVFWRQRGGWPRVVDITRHSRRRILDGTARLKSLSLAPGDLRNHRAARPSSCGNYSIVTISRPYGSPPSSSGCLLPLLYPGRIEHR